MEIVCIITSHRYGETIGGVQTFVKSLSKWLIENNIRTIILSRRLSFLNPVSIIFYNRSFKLVASKQIKTIHISRIAYYIHRLFYSLIATLSVLKLNKKHHISVIHAQDLNFGGLPAIIAGKILGIPVVLHSHGPYIYLLRYENRVWINIEICLNKFITQQADTIIVTDFITKNYLLSLGVNYEKVTIIPNAIEMKLFMQKEQNKVYIIRKELGVSKSDFLLGYIGRLSVEKNVDVLIKAFSSAREVKTQGLKLVIIGKGPEEIRLLKLVEKYNLGRFIVFTGWRTDVQSLLNAIDAFVLPSFIEGAPLSLLEAMASGKAIIASNIPSIQEIVTNGEEALLVKPYDVEALKRAILLLCTDKELNIKLRHNARERIKLYDVDKIYGRILNLYEELVHHNAT